MDVDIVVKDLGFSGGRLVFTESSYKFDASPHIMGPVCHTGRHGSFGFSCYCVKGVASWRLSPG